MLAYACKQTSAFLQKERTRFSRSEKAAPFQASPHATKKALHSKCFSWWEENKTGFSFDNEAFCLPALASRLRHFRKKNEPDFRTAKRQFLSKHPRTQQKKHFIRSALVGGGCWIRTSEVVDNRFTVCPLWPLGKSPIKDVARIGAGERSRTINLLITNQLLCH